MNAAASTALHGLGAAAAIALVVIVAPGESAPPEARTAITEDLPVPGVRGDVLDFFSGRDLARGARALPFLTESREGPVAVADLRRVLDTSRASEVSACLALDRGPGTVEITAAIYDGARDAFVVASNDAVGACIVTIVLSIDFRGSGRAVTDLDYRDGVVVGPYHTYLDHLPDRRCLIELAVDSGVLPSCEEHAHRLVRDYGRERELGCALLSDANRVDVEIALATGAEIEQVVCGHRREAYPADRPLDEANIELWAGYALGDALSACNPGTGSGTARAWIAIGDDGRVSGAWPASSDDAAACVARAYATIEFPPGTEPQRLGLTYTYRDRR